MVFIVGVDDLGHENGSYANITIIIASTKNICFCVKKDVRHELKAYDDAKFSSFSTAAQFHEMELTITNHIVLEPIPSDLCEQVLGGHPPPCSSPQVTEDFTVSG